MCVFRYVQTKQKVQTYYADIFSRHILIKKNLLSCFRARYESFHAGVHEGSPHGFLCASCRGSTQRRVAIIATRNCKSSGWSNPEPDLLRHLVPSSSRISFIDQHSCTEDQRDSQSSEAPRQLAKTTFSVLWSARRWQLRCLHAIVSGKLTVRYRQQRSRHCNTTSKFHRRRMGRGSQGWPNLARNLSKASSHFRCPDRAGRSNECPDPGKHEDRLDTKPTSRSVLFNRGRYAILLQFTV